MSRGRPNPKLTHELLAFRASNVRVASASRGLQNGLPARRLQPFLKRYFDQRLEDLFEYSMHEILGVLSF